MTRIQNLTYTVRWRSAERLFDTVQIVLVGKYTTLQDSYMSVVKALEHASMKCGRKLELKWVDSSNLEPEAELADPVKYHDAWRAVCSAKGILVPGGFGLRGTEGMIAAIKWAREKKVPFLGICLGFQIAVIEWARNVCGLAGKSSATRGSCESSLNNRFHRRPLGRAGAQHPSPRHRLHARNLQDPFGRHNASRSSPYPL